MSHRLTPWFTPDVKPARRGLYQRERNNIIMYSYWDGRQWFFGHIEKEMAYELYLNCGNSNVSQYANWRGLLNAE